jgi:hypothetical protein
MAAAVDPVAIYSEKAQPELQNEVGFSFWGLILTKQQRKWWERSEVYESDRRGRH